MVAYRLHLEGGLVALVSLRRLTPSSACHVDVHLPTPVTKEVQGLHSLVAKSVHK